MSNGSLWSTPAEYKLGIGSSATESVQYTRIPGGSLEEKQRKSAAFAALQELVATLYKYKNNRAFKILNPDYSNMEDVLAEISATRDAVEEALLSARDEAHEATHKVDTAAWQDRKDLHARRVSARHSQVKKWRNYQAMTIAAPALLILLSALPQKEKLLSKEGLKEVLRNIWHNMKLKRGKWRGGATWLGIMLALLRLVYSAPAVGANPGDFSEAAPVMGAYPSIPTQTTENGYTWRVNDPHAAA